MSFPPELLIVVFKNLSIEDLINAASVTANWLDIIKNHIHLDQSSLIYLFKEFSERCDSRIFTLINYVKEYHPRMLNLMVEYKFKPAILHFVKKFNLSSTEIANITIWDLCHKDDLDMTKWLHENYKFEYNQDCNMLTIERIIECACEKGHLEFLKWVVQIFEIDKQMINAFDEDPFVVSCSNGNLNIAQWLHEKFDSEPINKTHLLYLVCTDNYYDTLVWLFKKFDFSVQDIRNEDNLIFRSACENGSLKCLQYIHKTKYKFTRNDALEDECDAFKLACIGNHLNVAEWILDDIGLEIDDVGQHFIIEVWREEWNDNRLEITQWLCRRFYNTPLPAVGHQSDFNLLFQNVCARDHLDVATWLIRIVNILPHHARANDNEALRRACARGSIFTVIFLVNTFGLSSDDFAARKSEAFRHACENGHLETAQWIHTHFNINMQDVRDENTIQKTKEKGHAEVLNWLHQIMSAEGNH